MEQTGKRIVWTAAVIFVACAVLGSMLHNATANTDLRAVAVTAAFVALVVGAPAWIAGAVKRKRHAA